MKKKQIIILLIIIAISNIYAFFFPTEKIKEVYGFSSNLINMASPLIVAIDNESIREETKGYLVPKGAYLGPNDTEQVIIDYNVHINGAAGVLFTLIVDVFDIKVGGLVNPYDAVQIKVSEPSIVSSEVVQVSIFISLDISTLSEKDVNRLKRMIANKTISFAVGFGVTLS